MLKKLEKKNKWLKNIFKNIRKVNQEKRLIENTIKKKMSLLNIFKKRKMNQFILLKHIVFVFLNIQLIIIMILKILKKQNEKKNFQY